MALTIAGCKNTTTAPAAPAKSPDERAAELFPKPTLDIRTVGILLYDGYSTLDAMGRVFFVDLHKGPVENVNGMKVLVDTDDRLVVGFYDQCLHGALETGCDGFVEGQRSRYALVW